MSFNWRCDSENVQNWCFVLLYPSPLSFFLVYPASCPWEEHLRAETCPKFFRSISCQIRGQIYFFFLHTVKIKLKQSKRKCPSWIWLKAPTFSFDLLSFPIIISNCLLFPSPKGIKWLTGIYSIHWNFKNEEIKGRKNII